MSKMSKKPNEIGMTYLIDRVQDMIATKNQVMKEIIAGNDEYSVRLMKGNAKTGKTCWTVSLIPGHDCQNCKQCFKACYDLRNVCRFEKVRDGRAVNSAIHALNIKQFYEDIEFGIRYHHVKLLRFNVGGDFSYKDMPYIKDLALKLPNVTFHFFTKNYKDINRFIGEEGELPENMKVIMSAWEGLEMDNPYELPEAHIRYYATGKTTWNKPGKAEECKGNCSNCHMEKMGCLGAKKGEAIILNEH